MDQGIGINLVEIFSDIDFRKKSFRTNSTTYNILLLSIIFFNALSMPTLNTQFKREAFPLTELFT